MLQEINLRLKMVYDMIPECDILGDVGTDHAFLPIYAIQTGKCKKAIASDLREGPLYIAKKNIAASGLSNHIETIMSNGLKGYIGKDCNVIVIAGMGGLTICNILSDWVSDCKQYKYFPGNISLILQPNTHEFEVRKCLWDNGFEIIDEQAIKDGNHVYISFHTKYTDELKEYSEMELYVGKIMSKRMSENDILYFNSLKNKYNNILKGLLMRKAPPKEVLSRIILVQNILKELNNLL